jgi:hypothetical protein
MKAARKRLLLMFARKSLSDIEEGPLAGWSTITDYLEKKIRGSIAAAGEDLSALDPSGKSTIAGMDARIRKGIAQIFILAAQEIFVKIGGNPDPGELERSLKEIRKHLDKAGVQLEALDPSGAGVAEDKVVRMLRAAHRKAGVIELEKLERTGCPKTLLEVYKAVESIGGHFNAAGLPLTQTGNEEALAINERLDAVIGSLREKFFAAGGNIIMKPLKVGEKKKTPAPGSLQAGRTTSLPRALARAVALKAKAPAGPL